MRRDRCGQREEESLLDSNEGRVPKTGKSGTRSGGRGSSRVRLGSLSGRVGTQRSIFYLGSYGSTYE